MSQPPLARQLTPPLQAHRDAEQGTTHAHPTCTQCGDRPADYVSLADFHGMMRLTRLQTTIPITVLISMGTMLVCGVVIHPGMREINDLYPTLMNPKNVLIMIYWSTFYAFSIGFCILLMFARSERTKELFIHGVGLRFAVANCLIAAWSVCWTLRVFVAAEVFAIVNLLIVISISITLLSHPPSLMHPLNSIFVHGSVALLLAMLFELTWLHNGFVALKWVIRDEHMVSLWKWDAIIGVAVTNSIALFWEIGTHGYMLAIASEYLLFSLLFASVRIHPSMPESSVPKPLGLIVTIIIFLALHPLALITGSASHIQSRYRGDPEGQIRLPSDEEEEVGRAQQEARIEAEVEARVREREEGRNDTQSPPPPAGNSI